MNENAEKWVAALRSGAYEQGRGQLHKDDQFCCLGVACDLYVREGGHLAVETAEDGVRYNGLDGCLPQVVKRWLGLRTDDGMFDAGDRIHSLGGRNDCGASFAEIADLIESEPERLFAEER